MNLAQDLANAVELARGAGQIVLKHFGNVDRLTKTHATTTEESVTVADRESQRFIVAALRQRFPQDGVVGEESDTGESITFEAPNPEGRVWVIDPIDGTNNFIAGFPTFCVCIGLLVGGEPVLGVVYDVCRDDMYRSAKGQGAFLNENPIHVPQEPLGDGAVLMLTSNLLTKQGRLPAWVPRWMAQQAWKVRILGTAALEAIYVAAGIAHGAVTVNGKLWDIAAAAAIVLEAGGQIHSLDGKAIFPFDLRHYKGEKVPFVASAPSATATLLREIAENP